MADVPREYTLSAKSKKKQVDDIFAAIRECNVAKTTKFLKNKKTDLERLNESGHTALMVAAFTGSLEMVKLVVTAGKTRPNLETENSEGVTVLTCAANDGYFDICEFLLKQGTNPNHASRTSTTPLMHACSNGHEWVVNLLLENGANLQHQSLDGWNALLHASSGGHSRIIQTIIDRGGNPNQQTAKGWTPLICAATRGRTDAVDLLLRMGANPNHANYAGITALMLAASGGHTDCCRHLLARGALLGLVDQDGRTALDMAVKGNQNDTARFLHSYKDFTKREDSIPAPYAQIPQTQHQHQQLHHSQQPPQHPPQHQEQQPPPQQQALLDSMLSEEVQIEREKMDLLARVQTRRLGQLRSSEQQRALDVASGTKKRSIVLQSELDTIDKPQDDDDLEWAPPPNRSLFSVLFLACKSRCSRPVNEDTS